jgi:hypothetical protein
MYSSGKSGGGNVDSSNNFILSSSGSSNISNGSDGYSTSGSVFVLLLVAKLIVES